MSENPVQYVFSEATPQAARVRSSQFEASLYPDAPVKLLQVALTKLAYDHPNDHHITNDQRKAIAAVQSAIFYLEGNHA